MDSPILNVALLSTPCSIPPALAPSDLVLPRLHSATPNTAVVVDVAEEVEAEAGSLSTLWRISSSIVTLSCPCRYATKTRRRTRAGLACIDGVMVRQQERMFSVVVNQLPDYRAIGPRKRSGVGTTLTGIANLPISKPAFQAPNERMHGCRYDVTIFRSFLLPYRARDSRRQG